MKELQVDFSCQAHQADGFVLDLSNKSLVVFVLVGN
jgi:hypothetical protein